MPARPRRQSGGAAYDLTDYLISLGHRRIAFVGGPAGLHTSRQRLDGFRAAVERAGLEGDALYDGDFSYDLGHAAAVRMLAATELPDAVVGANDETAIGAIAALRQAGVAIPEDVSVAGMTDTRLARFSDLTTVNIPLYQFGAIAARSVIAGGAGRGAARDGAAAPPRAALDDGAAESHSSGAGEIALAHQRHQLVARKLARARG